MQEIFNLTHYSFNIFGIPPLIVGIITILIGLVVLIHENYSSESKTLFLLAITLFLWLITCAMVYFSTDYATALFWTKIEHLGVAFIPFAASTFTFVITNNFRKFRVYLMGIFLFGLISLYLVFKSNIFLSGLYKYYWGYFHKYGTFGLIFILVFGISMVINLSLQFRALKKSSLPSYRQRMKVLLLAYSIAYIGAVDFIPAYGIEIYPFGYIPIFIFLLLLTSAIWRYNLIDITPTMAYSHIIKNMDDLLIITDINGYVQLMNPSSEKFFGLSERSIANQHIHKLFPDKLLESKDTQALKQVISSLKNRELSFEDLNKKTRSVSISGSLLKNTSNKAIGFVFTANDRTEYKKALDNIKTAYKTTQTILEKMPVGIMILNMDKNIESINDAALKIMGLKKEEEIVGKPCLFKLLCYDEKNCCPLFKSGQERVTSESDIIGSGNKKVSVLKTALQTTINDKKVILEAFVDITQRKLLADQLNNYKEYLENQVEERTVELQTANKKLLSEVKIRKKIADSLQGKIDALENFQKETMRRESDMIEIKKMINGYCERLNRPRPYKLSFLKNGT